ncbi:MAG: alpha-ketoglutarate-dependent dioxygenase AlkB [Alphaproteobacteria bacterium]|nr:alpha-ketoglutarate-dependent dioxygenase AlkB [Alphaproteobacteria bacterium]
MIELAPGLIYLPDYLARAAQEEMVDDVRAIVRAAPLFTPVMPRTGKAFSVQMTNCGTLGWMSDRDKGYRYEAHHPQTGEAWPAIPASILNVWRTVTDCPASPEACLVNFYTVDARMGLHQDRDEEALDAPVVSISLGGSCLFRFGGAARGGRTKSQRLNSGDVVVIGGPSRLCFHGVDRIYPATSALLAQGGRINLTLRRVRPVQAPD